MARNERNEEDIRDALIEKASVKPGKLESWSKGPKLVRAAKPYSWPVVSYLRGSFELYSS